jgi:hypothetical protein
MPPEHPTQTPVEKDAQAFLNAEFGLSAFNLSAFNLVTRALFHASVTIATSGACWSRFAMSRKLRIEYPGAMYHVMNRGDQREDIFRDDEDPHQFLSTLGDACAFPTC